MITLLSSLRARMTMGFTVCFGAFSLIVWAGVVLWSRHAAHQDAQERIHSAARLVAQEWDGNAAARSVARAFVEAHEDMRLDNIAMLIVDDAGNILGRNRHPATTVASRSTLSWPNPRHDGWLIHEVRTRNATVVAGMDWHTIEAALRRQMLLLLLFALLTTAIAAVSAWTLVGRTLRPIGALADQATRASGDALQSRLLPPSEDAEVRHLVETLNGFLMRLRENTLAREQFYAAAAHELRTPLAVLSASVEVALSRPRETSEYQETLTDLQGQTQRLTNLVQDLLTLNRLDMNTSADESKEVIDVADICERSLLALAAVAAAREIRIRTDLESGRDILASFAHTTMLVQNLIDNAMKYAAPGGIVFVSLYPASEGMQLRVYNDYESSEKLQFDRWFEPFYREDMSRSSATDGNGLGLAICRRIVSMNSWSLSFERVSGGISALVTFVPVD